MGAKYSAAILVGGKSTRMGQDKALLKLNNERFIDHLINEFSECEEVFLSVAKKGDYADTGIASIADENREIGPIEGIRQSLIYAHNDYVFVCAADMPFLKKDLADYISEFISSDYDAYVIRDEKRLQPLCAIYHKSVLPVIEEQIANGKYKLFDVLSRIRVKYIDIHTSTFDSKTIKNINTREDYAAIKEPVVFCVSGIKNSGKTYLISKLINEFIKDGLSVGVIKHDGHDFECDIKGTDSYRFYELGAAGVAVYSDYQTFIHKRQKYNVEELIEQMHEYDVVIIEGLKDSAYPKVEVVRSAVSTTSVCDPDTLICIATDSKYLDKSRCPVYGLNDVYEVFCCIKKAFLINEVDDETYKDGKCGRTCSMPGYNTDNSREI